MILFPTPTPTKRHLSMSGHIFITTRLVFLESGKRAGMLLAILQYTGQPSTTKIIWPKMSIVLRLRNLASCCRGKKEGERERETFIWHFGDKLSQEGRTFGENGFRLSKQHFPLMGYIFCDRE